MQCKELEFVLESEGLVPLPAEAREHLAGCSACQGYLADLSSIVLAAKTLPAEVAPPDRIWISLRAQLEAEGLIKESIPAPEPAPWWDNFSAKWKPRTWATATTGLALLAITIFVTRTSYFSHPNPAPQQPVTAASHPAEPPAPAPASAPPATPVIPKLSARASTPGPHASTVKELAPSPSEAASLALNIAERDVPDMELAGNSQVDASLRQNLRTLNEFIAECEQHLKKNPQDQLAREYLNTAYQQKADLLAAMLESGRSEH